MLHQTVNSLQQKNAALERDLAVRYEIWPSLLDRPAIPSIHRSIAAYSPTELYSMLDYITEHVKSKISVRCSMPKST